MRHFIRTLFLFGLTGQAFATEILDLDVIAYDNFIHEDPDTLRILDKALQEKGIVGMRGLIKG